MKLHTNSEDISEVKLSSLLPSAQSSHLITRTLLVLNKFLFDSNNGLAPLQILSYQQLNVVAPISSLAMQQNFIFFLLA